MRENITNKEKEEALAAMKMAAKMLRTSEQAYVIFSHCTRMPYVVCDDKTYDDEIFYIFKRKQQRRL